MTMHHAAVAVVKMPLLRLISSTICLAKPAFTALQVWTWRGGEAIVCCDYSANYGRGEYRVVVRTGGLKTGAVRVLWATCFAQAMEQLGVAVPSNEAELVKKIVRQGMEEVVAFEVPLLVEMGMGANWAEAHE